MKWLTNIFGKGKTMAKHRRKSKLKYAVKCGKRVRSHHRKKSAAHRAIPKRGKNCRVVKRG